MPAVRCGKRKEDKCKEAEECLWDGTKCLNQNKVVKSITINKPLTNMEEVSKVKKITCGRRKEETCNQVPTICVWNKEVKKCIELILKKTDNQKDNEKTLNVEVIKKPALKKIVKKVEKKQTLSHPSPPKVNVPSVHTPSPQKVQSVQTLSPPKVHVPSPLSKKMFEKLHNRHCSYYSNDSFMPVDTVNLDDCFKTVYDSKYKDENNIHIGQRKLLLSEIQLLTKYYESNKKDPVLLYVGAAPGTHLILLSIMFPKVFFVLYDGASFDPILKQFPNIYDIHEGKEGFVTTKLINDIKPKFKNMNLLFVSDIRLGDDDQTKFEHGVTRDMQLQEEWMDILKPKMSLLKFRMSYNMTHGEKLKYTKGEILYGIWPKPLSGETRLLVNQEDVGNKIDYDFKNYEEVMFFHNKYERSYCYQYDNNEIPKVIRDLINSKNNSYCPCFDCLSELQILDKYARLMDINLLFVVNQFAHYMNHEKNPAFQTKGKGKYPKKALQNVKMSCKESWFKK